MSVYFHSLLSYFLSITDSQKGVPWFFAFVLCLFMTFPLAILRSDHSWRAAPCWCVLTEKKLTAILFSSVLWILLQNLPKLSSLEFRFQFTAKSIMFLQFCRADEKMCQTIPTGHKIQCKILQLNGEVYCILSPDFFNWKFTSNWKLNSGWVGGWKRISKEVKRKLKSQQSLKRTWMIAEQCRQVERILKRFLSQGQIDIFTARV